MHHRKRCDSSVPRRPLYPEELAARLAKTRPRVEPQTSAKHRRGVSKDSPLHPVFGMAKD